MLWPVSLQLDLLYKPGSGMVEPFRRRWNGRRHLSLCGNLCIVFDEGLEFLR